MRHIRFTLLTLLIATLPAFADGLIIVDRGPIVADHFPFAPLEVKYHRVTVQIDEDVAVTSVDQEFYNPSDKALEGTYIFPLPAGAHIDRFSIDVGGKVLDAELLDADKARQTYEQIVREMKDPALLEYVGRGAFKARVYPIEPHSTKRIAIKYTQLLKADDGLSEYTYPLNTEKFSSKPIGDVSLDVRVHCADPLKTITCPTHDAAIHRDGEYDATISMRWKDQRPDTDFELLFSRDRKAVGLRLMTFKQGESDGYYMLLASPGLSTSDPAKAIGKDIIFVLDRSGSMQGKKMEQARKALKYCIENLRPQDRFGVIRFSTEAETLFPELRSADNHANIDEALSWIDRTTAVGGTAIDDALAAAAGVHAAPSDETAKRPTMIVFLTDGRPTVGSSDEDQIIQRELARAKGSRLFCFGLGNDVNTHLLDRLSDATRSASTYVGEDEDLELKLATFYAKVNEPAATDLNVQFDGDSIVTTEPYPVALPDLFKGQTLQMFGRYKGSGPAKIKLVANVGGESHEFVQDVVFSDHNTDAPFIPTLWATRRVGWLLDEMRQHGETKELKDEVVALARAHGIVTPYTAYLITEDESRRNVPVAMRGFDGLQRDRAAFGAAKDAYLSTQREAAAPGARAGAQAVQNAQAIGGLRTSVNTQTAAAQIMPATTQPIAGYRGQINQSQLARTINSRTFYQNGKQWTDVTAQSNQSKPQQVRFNSDDYFKLMAEHPESAAWLSLGSNLDVVIGDTLYQVRDN